MQGEGHEEPRGRRCSPGRPEKSRAGLGSARLGEAAVPRMPGAGTWAQSRSDTYRARTAGLSAARDAQGLVGLRTRSRAGPSGRTRAHARGGGRAGRPRAQSAHARPLEAGRRVRMRGTRVAVSVLCTRVQAALPQVSARGRRSSVWATSSMGSRGRRPRVRRAPASAPSPRCSRVGLARGSVRSRGRAGPCTCAAGPAGRLALRCRRLRPQLLRWG